MRMLGEHRNTKVSLKQASDKYGLERLNFNSIQRAQEIGIQERANINTLPRYYEAFGRNCPKKLLSKKKKTIQLELLPAYMDDEDAVLQHFGTTTQEADPLPSLRISLSESCGTSKDNRTALDSAESPLWCNTKNSHRKALSITCGYNDGFLFHDFDSESQHYTVEKKDNWTVPPALIKSQQQDSMFTDFYNFSPN